MCERISTHPEFEDAKIKYETFREEFYDFLSQYETWDQYLKELHESINVRYDRHNFIEKYLMGYYDFLTERFLKKNPFLEPYAYPSKDYITLKSEREAIKIKLELFNVSENELYYPNNFVESLHVHSARHSLAMFIKEGILNPVNQGKKFGMYMRPLTTFSGDKEFTHYYLSMFEFPHIILTRLENLSWILQVNGLMKISKFGGRYCTRIYKQEPAILFYHKYFFSWKYSFTREQLIEYCNKYNIPISKQWSRQKLIETIEERLKTKGISGYTIPPPNQTRHILNETEYPLYEWDQQNLEWVNTNTLTNQFPLYEKEYRISGSVKTQTGWHKTDLFITPNNLIQSMGINKYHSRNRRMENPNICIYEKSNPKTHFFIYNRLPLYEETPDQMLKIIAKSPIKLEDNPFEKEHPLAYTQSKEPEKLPNIEERFGCIICPYRHLSYYESLFNHNPYEYFYCMSIRLIASAKNIISEGREYWYEGKNVKCPIMPLDKMM